MKLSNTDIKEKTKMVVETISKDENGKYHYFEEMLNIFDNDCQTIIKEKMDNLIVLLEHVDKDNEMLAFQELDFEDTIWYII